MPSTYITELRKSLLEDVSDETAITKLKDIACYTNLAIQLKEDRKLDERRDFSKFESKSKEMSAPDIKLNQIFDFSESWNDSKDPRIVLIKGAGGMGKTTLVRRLVSEWCRGNIWHEKFEYVYRYQLRYLNNLPEKLSCFKLLFKHHSPNVSEKVQEDVWQNLKDNPEKVLLIFDGADEYDGFNTISPAEIPPVTDDSLDVPFNVLLYHLHSDKLMPGAYKLFTSRPSATALNCLQRFHRNIFIRGFEDPDIEHYIQTEYRDDEDRARWILNYLSQHTNIKAYCRIPAFCTMTSTCLSHLHDTQEQPKGTWDEHPCTMTQIMSLVLLHYIIDHHEMYKYNKPQDPWSVLEPIKEAFHNLSKIASWGMTSNPMKLTFTAKEIKACTGITITEKETALGILVTTKVPSHLLLNVTEDQWSFNHLLIQEYFAAVDLIGSPQQLSKMLKGQHHVIKMFAIGFQGDAKLRESLKPILPTNVSPSKYKEGAKQQLRRIKESPGDSLLPLRMVYESQQPDLFDVVHSQMLSGEGRFNFFKKVNAIFSRKRVFDLHSSNITALECQALAFFMKYTSYNIVSINLSKNPLGEQGMVALGPGLKHQANHLRQLYLWDCKLCGEALSVLCTSLAAGAGRLEELNLYDNPDLCVNGVEPLTETLLPHCQALRELRLFNTGLRDYSALRLGRAIKRHCTQMKRLGVWDDGLSAECKARLRAELPDVYVDF